MKRRSFGSDIVARCGMKTLARVEVEAPPPPVTSRLAMVQLQKDAHLHLRRQSRWSRRWGKFGSNSVLFYTHHAWTARMRFAHIV